MVSGVGGGCCLACYLWSKICCRVIVRLGGLVSF